MPPLTCWEARERKVSLPLHEAVGIVLEARYFVLRG